MGWIEILAIGLIPGSIKVSREFGKLDVSITPAVFMLIEFVCKKAKELLTSPSKPEEPTEVKTVS
jgi:hypothetical protein